MLLEHSSGQSREAWSSPLLPRVGETTSDERILHSDFGPCGGTATFDSPSLLRFRSRTPVEDGAECRRFRCAFELCMHGKACGSVRWLIWFNNGVRRGLSVDRYTSDSPPRIGSAQTVLLKDHPVKIAGLLTSGMSGPESAVLTRRWRFCEVGQ